MTLADIRELLLRELAASALSGRAQVDFKNFESGSPRFGLLLRIGKPLALRHVRRGKRILWHGPAKRIWGGWDEPHGDAALIVERVERTQVMFDSPRLVISMAHFLNEVVKGAMVDA